MRGRDRRPEAELAFRHPQRIARHARLEAGAVRAPLHQTVEVLAHGLDELGRGRPSEGRRRPIRRVGPGGGGRRRAQEGEEVPLALADAPADGGQLDRAGGATEVRRGLQGADGGPLHRGVHLPPVDAFGCDGVAAGVAIGGQQFGQRAEPADLALAAEAPGGGAQPADVLGGVAHVGELPVEDAAQPIGSNQEVADPVVAVHGHPRPVGRPTSRQPAQAELERRPHLAQSIEERQGVTQWVRRRQPFEGRRIDGVDGGQRAAGLAGQGLARRRPFLVAQDLARDGLALQALHHHPVGPELVALAERDDCGHRHAGCRRGTEQRTLQARPALLGGAAVHLQDERARPAAGGQEVEGAGDA